MFDDSIRDFLGSNARTKYEKFNLSESPVDILSFDKIFLECDIAQGMIFRNKRAGIVHNFTMDNNPGYKYLEKLRGNIQWYMMQSKDFISRTIFKSKNENKQIVSFNGQSFIFSIIKKEILILINAENFNRIKITI